MCVKQKEQMQSNCLSKPLEENDMKYLIFI